MTNRLMIDTAALFAACSAMNAAMITAMPARDIGWLSAAVAAGLVGSPGLARAAERTAIMAAVVAMLSTATAAIANRTARLPNVPMIKVARGGPATQATETIARVFTTSDGLAPEYLRWAKSSELPTPAGPPSTSRPMTAIGKDVVTYSRTASASVNSPHASNGHR